MMLKCFYILIMICTAVFKLCLCQRRTELQNDNLSKTKYLVYFVKSTRSTADDDTWTCAGALVSSTQILTAATCLVTTEPIYAIAGYKKFVPRRDLDSDNCTKIMKRRVIKISIPKEYTSSTIRPSRRNAVDLSVAKVDKPYMLFDQSYRDHCSYEPQTIEINFDISNEVATTTATALGWTGQEAQIAVDGSSEQTQMPREMTAVTVKKTSCASPETSEELERREDKYLFCATVNKPLNKDDVVSKKDSVFNRCPDGINLDPKRNKSYSHGAPLIRRTGSKDLIIGVALNDIDHQNHECDELYRFVSTAQTAIIIKCLLETEATALKLCNEQIDYKQNEVRQIEIEWPENTNEESQLQPRRRNNKDGSLQLRPTKDLRSSQEYERQTAGETRNEQIQNTKHSQTYYPQESDMQIHQNGRYQTQDRNHQQQPFDQTYYEHPHEEPNVHSYKPQPEQYEQAQDVFYNPSQLDLYKQHQESFEPPQTGSYNQPEAVMYPPQIKTYSQSKPDMNQDPHLYSYQPQMDSYIQPQAKLNPEPLLDSYNQPQIKLYNQPEGDSYNQPQMEPPCQPQVDSIVQPQEGSYSQPSFRSCDEPQVESYNQPPQPETYGKTELDIYNQHKKPQAEAYSQPSKELYQEQNYNGPQKQIFNEAQALRQVQEEFFAQQQKEPYDQQQEESFDQPQKEESHVQPNVEPDNQPQPQLNTDQQVKTTTESEKSFNPLDILMLDDELTDYTFKPQYTPPHVESYRQPVSTTYVSKPFKPAPFDPYDTELLPPFKQPIAKPYVQKLVQNFVPQPVHPFAQQNAQPSEQQNMQSFGNHNSRPPERPHIQSFEQQQTQPTENPRVQQFNQQLVRPVSEKLHIQQFNQQYAQLSDKPYMQTFNQQHAQLSEKSHVQIFNQPHAEQSDKLHVETFNEQHVQQSDQPQIRPFAERQAQSIQNSYMQPINQQHAQPSDMQNIQPSNQHKLLHQQPIQQLKQQNVQTFEPTFVTIQSTGQPYNGNNNNNKTILRDLPETLNSHEAGADIFQQIFAKEAIEPPEQLKPDQQSFDDLYRHLHEETIDSGQERIFVQDQEQLDLEPPFEQPFDNPFEDITKLSPLEIRFDNSFEHSFDKNTKVSTTEKHKDNFYERLKNLSPIEEHFDHPFEKKSKPTTTEKQEDDVKVRPQVPLDDPYYLSDRKKEKK